MVAGHPEGRTNLNIIDIRHSEIREQGMFDILYDHIFCIVAPRADIFEPAFCSE